MGKKHVKTLVIFCQDHRFLKNHLDFIRETLSLKEGEFTIFPILGGASRIARTNRDFEADFEVVMGDILFYVDAYHETISEIVLINHEDCKRTGLERPQSEDELQEASLNLRVELPPWMEIKISTYFAPLRVPGNPDQGLCFELIEPRMCQFVGLADE